MLFLDPQTIRSNHFLDHAMTCRVLLPCRNRVVMTICHPANLPKPGSPFRI